MTRAPRRFVLTFHGIGEIDGSLESGERDVWLSHEGFVSVLDEVAGLDGIEITFDDGNASDYDIAFSELRARELRGIFFVVADRIDRAGYLSSEQLREMAGADMTIGSHGMHHVSWRNLSDQDLSVELVDAKEAISSAAGRDVTLAACPFGGYDRRVVNAARSAGYSRLYTSDRGPARPGDFVQPRSSLRRAEPVNELRALLREGSGTQAKREVRKLVKRWR